MISNITILVAIAVVVIMIVDLTRSYKNAFGGKLDNDYKRWSEDELFITAYIAVFVEDEVRLDDSFQLLLANTLKRSERAVNEKIRRLSTIGSPKSDASAKDESIVYQIAQMEEFVAEETFLVCLDLVGATRRQQRAIYKNLG